MMNADKANKRKTTPPSIVTVKYNSEMETGQFNVAIHWLDTALY